MEECYFRETSWACWGTVARPAPKVSAIYHFWVARNPKSPLWGEAVEHQWDAPSRRLPTHGDHVVRALSCAVHREAIATHSDSFADRGVARTAPISLLSFAAHVSTRRKHEAIVRSGRLLARLWYPSTASRIARVLRSPPMFFGRFDTVDAHCATAGEDDVRRRISRVFASIRAVQSTGRWSGTH